MAKTKKKWVEPEIRKFGTFESATQGCNKSLGASDGYTFQGQAIICTAS